MKAYRLAAIGICALLLLPASGKMEPVPTESEARTEDAAGREIGSVGLTVRAGKNQQNI